MKSSITKSSAIIAVLIALISTAMAQGFAGIASGSAAATGAQTPVLLPINNGATSYALTTTTTGAPAAISIKIEGSTDNGATYNICGVATTSTAAAQTTCTGTYDHVRANVTTLNGGTAPTIIWVLTSVVPQPVTATLSGAIPAGSNVIGKVGIDQTTPGATNGITIAPTSAAAAGIAPAPSGALETNHVFKAGPGNVYSICATIGATSGYLMVFDATSAPVDGAVTPKMWVYIPTLNTTANTGCLSYGGLPPGVFATGITAVFSTTGPFTKTASNAAFSGSVQ